MNSIGNGLVVALLCVSSWCPLTASAANHLDTPTTVMNPRADIGDVFSWMSADGKRLNLVMTIVGHSFSEELTYTFHIDSGRQFSKTTASTAITCKFASMSSVKCLAGSADFAQGDPSAVAGLASSRGRFRVFAGLRDDPFINNVKGFRAGYEIAAAKVRAGVPADDAGCPRFDADTSRQILTKFREVDGKPATDFLRGWTPSSLVISVDRDIVAIGGDLLAIWATTSNAKRQLDRMGRPLTQNALLATLGPAERADELKERFNETTPATFTEFVTEIEKGLALYDAFDAHCGNQLLADRSAAADARYAQLARVLADDRLWVDSASSVCRQFLAVELTHAAGRKSLATDCGGRTVTDDSIDVYRALLVNGTTSGVEDGVDTDDHTHSLTAFPFLAAPGTASGY
ncbi:hypothetical protein HNQ60_005253 [Povalibacter uvarum]|uniref:DUF4331 domain-containing protein n=1 Tax=Povalibacter uvarum TaxID=732238 RepID=A0A841HSG7_9GAMM|nr:DUF4331 family protein [Povalibacter uvarum]MBB6096331.1 hypothetical protein [Povalibacter uvarum]